MVSSIGCTYANPVDAKAPTNRKSCEWSAVHGAKITVEKVIVPDGYKCVICGEEIGTNDEVTKKNVLEGNAWIGIEVGTFPVV